MSRSRVMLACTLFAFAVASNALSDPRPPEVMTSAEIGQAIQRLNVLGSVLYVGAHAEVSR